MFNMCCDSSSDEELPTFNLGTSNAQEHSSMPTAEEVLALRRMEDAENERIKNLEQEIRELSFNNSEENTPQEPSQDLCSGQTIELDMDYLKKTLVEPYIDTVTRYLSYFDPTNNIDAILNNMLESMEKLVNLPEVWNDENFICMCVILSHLSISTLSLKCLRHICNAKRLLYSILNEKCTNPSQVNKLGIALMKTIPTNEHRLQLAIVLDGGVGDNITLLTKGIVKQSLKEWFTDDNTAEECDTVQYTTRELIPLVNSKWVGLHDPEQFILVQFLSKNLKLLEIDIKRDVINRNQLFKIMKLRKLSFNNINHVRLLKLKFYLCRMQMIQNCYVPKIMEEINAEAATVAITMPTKFDVDPPDDKQEETQE